MKRLLTILTLLLAMFTVTAGEHVATTIDAVTVYRQTARISHTGMVDIPAGTSELVIDNLSSAIIIPSIQVGLDGNVTILSVTGRINYMKPNPPTAQLQKLTDTLETVNDQLAWVQNQVSVYTAEEALMNANQKLGGTQTGFTAAQLQELANLYRNRVLEIREKILKLGKDAKALTEHKQKLESQMYELNNKKFDPTGEIVVTIMAKSAIRSSMHCDYLVNNAGWTPIYDLRATNVEKPVTLNYRAQVYQSTGYDWKDVKLTVSTGNPSIDNSRPVLVPLYIDFYAPFVYNYDKSSGDTYRGNMNSMQYKAQDELKLKEDTSADLEQMYTVAITETQLNVEYDIDIAQSIPSDGKTHQVPLKEYEVPATYTYHIVPGLNKGAFLLAKISDWGKYNLLPGKANLFFEGRYVGQSDINPLATADTLLLSLGRDEKINVNRIAIDDKESHSFFGGTRKEKRTYEISIRNNKGKAVDIEVLDQVPVSNQQDIKVELLEKGDAEYTAEIGKLLWKVNLKPGETKKLRFSFEVSYPKGKQVSPF